MISAPCQPTVVARLAVLVLLGCKGSPAAEPPDESPAASASETKTPREGSMHNSDDKREGNACKMRFEAAELPHRTATMLERDRGAVSVAAHTLHGTSSRGGPRTTPDLDTDLLQQAATSKIEAERQAAALLIGRCRAEDAAADARLARALEGLAGEDQPPSVRTEAAMSQVLRGGGDEARDLLRKLAGAEAAHEPWRAAAYLAQTGDASGWPGILAGARSEQNAQRAEALEAAVAFAPLQGEKSGDGPVNPQELIADAAKDSAVTVRQSVPRLLIEVEHPEARKRIEAMAKNDASAGVQAMAQHALHQLAKQK